MSVRLCTAPSQSACSDVLLASSNHELRQLFVSQARLLIRRIELGYGLRFDSVKNLCRVGVALALRLRSVREGQAA
jgi:hypothetical protein